jgi:ribosome biogenesis GTPase / thiamine phosphate phosphatase
MELGFLGWDGFFAERFAPWAAAGHRPARVVAAPPGGFLLATEHGELPSQVTGRPRHLAGPCVAGPPAVGDWVCLREGRIQAVLPRRTAVTHRRPGDAAGGQVLAANVDLVLLVVAAGRDGHPRRLERLRTLAWESGAWPVVVLGKADRCADLGAELQRLAEATPGVEVHAVSCFTGEGLAAVAAMLRPGRTAVLLGSSGVGKSTLVNRLAGRDLLATGEGTGSHRLVALAGGGLAIDTPGLRKPGPVGGHPDPVPAAQPRRLPLQVPGR